MTELTERRTERLYLCSDLVQDSYLKNTFLPILRSVDPTQEGTLDLEFGRPYYNQDASDGDESSVNIYKRRSTVLHASFEKKKMGSIEIYDHKNKRWVPYVPDYKKWEQHFTDVSEGRARADHRGRYPMGTGARWRSHTHKVELDTPKVELVTPVAQTLEMAKSELARQKVIRGKKRRGSFNQLDEL